MHRLYTVLLYLALPFILIRLFWKGLNNPAYRQRIGERFALLSVPKQKKTIWIHAVSVGEAQAVEPLIRSLLKRYPDTPLVVTTTTPTGSERVLNLFGESVIHTYFPYDIPFAINRFLDHFQPSLLVMVETEIWPNLITICHKRNTSTLLANARLSEKSALRYAYLKRFTQAIFRKIGVVAAQAEADALRFRKLGVPVERIQITGSIKFDIALNATLSEQGEAFKNRIDHRPVWVAASTHDGEDELILQAFKSVLKKHPAVLLILVPRHPDRFDAVNALCEQQNFRLVRRSSGEPYQQEHQILLGDTMGELMLFFAAADVAFVGGSLVPTGGHNILEPAALGVPVLFGPHMFNFSAISELLLKTNAAVQIRNVDELADNVQSWFNDASERTRVGENGRRVVGANRGALDRLSALTSEMLDNQQEG